MGNNNDEEVLSNISFKIKPGEVFGIIGPTGSGKSSLVQLIPRLYDTTAGTVRVGGHDVREYRLQIYVKMYRWYYKRTRYSLEQFVRTSYGEIQTLQKKR